jgi:hypothetical protein
MVAKKKQRQAGEVFSLYTVYESPSDYPGEFVARRWEVGSAGPEPVATSEVHRALELDVLRKRFIERGLARVPRAPDDDACIVEVWM